jgi:hypothetical protein
MPGLKIGINLAYNFRHRHGIMAQGPVVRKKHGSRTYVSASTSMVSDRGSPKIRSR